MSSSFPLDGASPFGSGFSTGSPPFGSGFSTGSPPFGSGFSTGSPPCGSGFSSETRYASFPQYSNGNHPAVPPHQSRMPPHAVASADNNGIVVPSHQHFTHHQQRHTNSFIANSASPTRWIEETALLPNPGASSGMRGSSDANWPWPNNAGAFTLSQSPSPSSAHSGPLLALDQLQAGTNVQTPRGYGALQQRFGDVVSPRRIDGRRQVVDMQRTSARSGRSVVDIDAEYLGEHNTAGVSRESRPHQQTPRVPPNHQLFSPSVVDFSGGSYTSPSANLAAAHHQQGQASISMYASSLGVHPQSARMLDMNLLSSCTPANSHNTNRPTSGRGAIMPSTPTAAASPTAYLQSPITGSGVGSDVRNLMQKRWQNLNIVFPLFVPGGTVVTTKHTGENTYVFPDSMPGAQLLFSSVGRVCDTWASYLRLRVAVIQKCPEFLVPQVVGHFNTILGEVPRFNEPVTLRCAGIGKHTINNRNNAVGPTYRYDTIGQTLRSEDKDKMKAIFEQLGKLCEKVNDDLVKDLKRLLLSATGDSQSDACGLKFKYSPCVDLKISVREGSPCESHAIDSLIASGSGFASPWSQQFAVEEVGISEIRVERDKAPEVQRDPFFQSDSSPINTRAMSRAFDGKPARVVLVHNTAPPPVENRTFRSAYEAGKAIYGCTYYTLGSLLQTGRASLIPDATLSTTAANSGQSPYFACATLSRTSPSAYAPAVSNFAYQRTISQQQNPPVAAFNSQLQRDSIMQLQAATAGSMMPHGSTAGSCALSMSPPTALQCSPVLGGVVSQFSPRAIPAVATPVAFLLNSAHTPQTTADTLSSPMSSNGWLQSNTRPFADLGLCPRTSQNVLDYNGSSNPRNTGSMERVGSSDPSGLVSGSSHELLHGLRLGLESSLVGMPSSNDVSGQVAAAAAAYSGLDPLVAQRIMNEALQAAVPLAALPLPGTLTTVVDGVGSDQASHQQQHGMLPELDIGEQHKRLTGSRVASCTTTARDDVPTTASSADFLDFTSLELLTSVPDGTNGNGQSAGAVAVGDEGTVSSRLTPTHTSSANPFDEGHGDISDLTLRELLNSLGMHSSESWVLHNSSGADGTRGARDIPPNALDWIRSQTTPP
eukprot:Lankesteria_metandrocarpae@DN4651_c0_g1_i1.p1